MQGDGALRFAWVPNAVISHRIFDEDNPTLVKDFILGTNKVVVLIGLVTFFLHRTRNNTHPTSITGMIMDWTMHTRIPAKEEESVGLIVG